MLLFKSSQFASATICAFAILSGNAHAQQVAILDSGVDPDAGYNIVPGFNYFLNTDDTSDVSAREGEGHGTISVRVASEAFNGEIVPFVITDGAGLREFETQTTAARDSALSDILGRSDVRVIGITWGTQGIVSSSASLIPELSNANKVTVIMAGNDFAAQPNTLSTTSFNLAGVIIVGGSDADGVLLAPTNQAGTTQNKYVVANGLPEPDSTSGGSSWAAARISGIAGAVLQQNPDLTAQEVVDVILDSAEDLGDPGTDNVYGRGFIRNAQQVLSNVMGPVVVPTQPTPPANSGGGGGGGGGGAAGLLVGGALVGALVLMRKPKGKLEKTLVLDSYGRAFRIDLGDQIVVDDGSLHLNEFFHALDQESVSDGFSLAELNTDVVFAATTNTDHRFDMIEYFADKNDVVLHSEKVNMSFALESRLAPGVALTAGYQVSPKQAFDAMGEIESHPLFGSSSFISGQAFSSVLSGFSNQANTVSVNYQPAKSAKTSFKMGLVSVNQKQRFGQDSFSSILEGKYKFNDAAGISLQFGQIEEQGSLFGGSAGGLFGVETATTYAVNLTGSLRASEKFSLVANYGMGRTNVNSSDDSLLNNFSSLRSDWYGVGVIGNNVWRGQDQLGFSISQPLKILSGNVNLSIPTHRDFSGAIAFDRERINLGETNATEQRLEGYYRTMLTDKLELGSFLSFRRNPNHVSDYGNEMLFMATLRYQQ